MKIKLDTLNLMETLKYFYMLTGIRSVIFDADFEEVFSYPEKACDFCSTIRKNENLMDKCRKCDIEAFKKCVSMEEIYIYKCHAGLVEAAMPIKHENRLIGYMMLGQITDMKDKNDLKKLEREIYEEYSIECDTKDIKYKNKNQILGASKILELCTDYMLLKEMIGAESEKIIAGAKKYIDEHISEQINIYDICNHVGVNRTKLYEMFKKEYGIGIATYIREKRLAKAKRLIKDTDLSISEISSLVGFSDYNYFSRVYKSKFKISPHKERDNGYKA